MRYANIENVRQPVSKIVFGTAGDMFHYGEDCDALLDGVLSLGINAIDTARVYGDAERVVGDWMRRRRNRNAVILEVKGCHPAEDGTKRVCKTALWEDFETSCELLGTNYIDIYMLHRDDFDVPAADIAEMMNELCKSGRVGAIGGSNWTAARIRDVNAYAKARGLVPFTVSSPNYCLAEQVDDMFGWGCESLSGDAKAWDRGYYRDNGIAVMSYSCIGRGFFSGRLTSDNRAHARDILDEYAFKAYDCDANYERLGRCEELAKRYGTTVPVIAMAWLLCQDMNTFAVVGSSSLTRMRQNLEALALSLSPEELRYLG